MSWIDTLRKAVTVPKPPPATRESVRPPHLDLPAPQDPYWPGPPHAEIFWPDWGDEWRQLWFNQGFPYQRSSLVMSGVNFLGTVLNEAAPKLERMEGDEWVIVTEHPYLDFLADPNPHMSGEDFLKDFAYWWFTSGNCYWYKRRDKAGRLVELWPLQSDRVRPYTAPDSGDYITYYEFAEDNSRGLQAPPRIWPEDLIHFRYALDPRDRRIGRSPLEAVILELAADQEAISYSAAVMKNFGVPPFLVSPKPSQSDTYQMKAEEMKREVIASQQGSRRGTPMVFNRPVDLTAFGFSPDQMAVDKSRRLPEERVAGVLGIPGVVLQFGSFLDRSTYNNVESARRMAWDNCVIPTLRAISGTLRRSLLPEFVVDPVNWWPGFDYSTSPAMAEDVNAIYQRQTLGYDKGWIKRNEARSAAGLSADDPEDDAYKPAPTGGFGFSSHAPEETKQMPLAEPWDYQMLAEYYRTLAPPEYAGLITARKKNEKDTTTTKEGADAEAFAET